MKTAKLVMSERYNMFDLVVDGKIISDVTYNKNRFAGKGLTKDRVPFDTAAELGLTKISVTEYDVSDVDAFLAWAKIPAAKTVGVWGIGE